MSSKNKTEAIRYRQIRVGDIPGFHSALDQISREKKFLARATAPDLMTTTAFVAKIIEHAYPQTVALAGDRLVGWCDIIPRENPHMKHVGGLGMGVIKEFRGRGIGSELLQLTIEASKIIGLERIELEVFTHNSAAVALYERFKFTHEGTKARAFKMDGQYFDEDLMALFM